MARWILVWVVGLICNSAAAVAQQGAPASQAAFVILMRSDTLGIERFVRSDTGMTGEITFRGQPRLTYSVRLTGPGRASTATIAAYQAAAAPDAPPFQRATIQAKGDSMIVEIVTTITSIQRIPTVPDASLLINASFALVEPLIERALAIGGDSVAFPVFLTTGGQTLTMSYVRAGRDSAVIRFGPQRLLAVTRGSTLLRARVPEQSLLVERVEGPAAARVSLGKPDYSAPAGAPYTAEPVTVRTRTGHVLAGTLTMPRPRSGRVPAVVTISGSGPQDRDEYIPLVPGYRIFRQLADTLGRRGIAVLRLDDRGTGESSGEFGTATSADFAADVREAVAWLRARDDVDPARIALLGHSEGGLIAPMVAATDRRLAGIVVLAGPSKVGRAIIEDQLRYGVEHDTTIAAASRDSALASRRAAFDSTAGRAPWFRYMLAFDPLPVARRVKAPVLILHGATDRQVTAEQAEQLGAAIRLGGNRDVTVRVYPDLNHLFLHDPSGNPAGYVRLENGRIGSDVMGQIADWLVARLAPRSARP